MRYRLTLPIILISGGAFVFFLTFFPLWGQRLSLDEFSLYSALEEYQPYKYPSSLLGIGLIVVGSILIKKKRIDSQMLLRAAILITIIWAIFVNLSLLAPLGGEIKFMIENPSLSYDEKMRIKWGHFYDYMLFVRKNTPPDAIIMFPPPRYTSSLLSNGHLMSYFIYPRRLVELDAKAPESSKTHTYLLITSKGDTWPLLNFSIEEVLYLPASMVCRENWGIAKLVRKPGKVSAE